MKFIVTRYVVETPGFNWTSGEGSKMVCDMRVRCSNSSPSGEPVDASLRTLIAKIINQHHSYLKRELPVIETALAEVARGDVRVFAERASTLVTLFLRFRRELEGHMKREEITLFPLIEQLEAAVAEGTPKPRYSFGSLSNAILFMNEDHEFGHKLLKLMDEISHGFTPGADAPPAYAAAMARLRALARDLDEHVRKEDKSLFPEAIRLESSFVLVGKEKTP